MHLPNNTLNGVRKHVVLGTVCRVRRPVHDVMLNLFFFHSSSFDVPRPEGSCEKYLSLPMSLSHVHATYTYSSGSTLTSTPYSSAIHAQNFSHLLTHSLSLWARSPLPNMPSLMSCVHSFALWSS